MLDKRQVYDLASSLMDDTINRNPQFFGFFSESDIDEMQNISDRDGDVYEFEHNVVPIDNELENAKLVRRILKSK